MIASWVRAFDRIDRRAAGRLAVLLIPALLLAVLAWQHRWTSDDGFINLRIVQQMREGHGPVFNAGERVEAGTSIVWLVVLFFSDLLTPLRLEHVALVAALAFSVGGLALAVLGTRRLLATLHPERSVLLPLGALAFAVIPASWDYSTSALESGLGFGWLGACWWTLTWTFSRSGASGAQPSTHPFWVPMLLGLGPLIRPDFAIMSAGFLVALLVIAPARGWKAGGRTVAIALALPLAYQVFRMGYYAALVPNTALAKEAGRSHWTQGWRYLADFVNAYAAWIPLVLLAVGVVPVLLGSARADARARVLILAPIVAGVLHAGYWVRVGGDFMHGRMLLPSMFCVLLPLAVVAVRRRTWIVAAVVLTWAVFCLVALRVPYEGSYGTERIADERGYYIDLAGTGPHPVTIDDYDGFKWWTAGIAARDLVRAGRRGIQLDPLRTPELLVPARPDARPAAPLFARFGSVGIFGYAAGTDVYVADWYGLTDPITSRVELTRRARPGHEKRLDPEWLIARFGRPHADLPGDLSPAEVADARRALACPELRDLLVAIDEPLEPGRFLSNIFDSFELTSLRFPSDARLAARQLCGVSGDGT